MGANNPIRNPAHARRFGLAWISLGALVILLLGAWANAFQPYSPEPDATPGLDTVALWALLYLPLIVLPLAAGWQAREFGFTLGKRMALAALLMGTACMLASARVDVGWGSAAWEAFARTGEEVFFRGFLIALLLRLLEGRRLAWLWACLASALLFALVHTQTFQPGFLEGYSSPQMPVLYKIIERLLNVAGIGLVFALLRWVTRSILPGAIAHAALNGSILTLPFVVLIYLLVMLAARHFQSASRARGEEVLEKS